MYLYSWNAGSESGKALASALKVRRIRHENSTFKGSNNKVVINWGSSRVPQEVTRSKVINDPEKVRVCSNKLDFFNAVSNGQVSIPDWTTDPAVAFTWVAAGDIVCARTILNGHSAQGLVLMTRDDMKSHVNAPLYTKYIPKTEEYRVHVFGGRVIDVQRKAIRPGYIEENGKPNFKIRNLANGFIYVRNDVNPNPDVNRQAITACDVVGLDFGAVDIVWNEKRQKAFVLEINTAPGLEGTTLQNYVNAFKEMK